MVTSSATDSAENTFNKLKREYESAVASGKFELAIKIIDELLSIVPDNAGIWNDRGIILRKLGRVKEAVESYEHALKCEPPLINAWLNKGFALIELADYLNALVCFNTILQVFPYNREALNGRERCLQALHEQQQQQQLPSPPSPPSTVAERSMQEESIKQAEAEGMTTTTTTTKTIQQPLTTPINPPPYQSSIQIETIIKSKIEELEVKLNNKLNTEFKHINEKLEQQLNKGLDTKLTESFEMIKNELVNYLNTKLETFSESVNDNINRVAIESGKIYSQQLTTIEQELRKKIDSVLNERQSFVRELSERTERAVKRLEAELGTIDNIFKSLRSAQIEFESRYDRLIADWKNLNSSMNDKFERLRNELKQEISPEISRLRELKAELEFERERVHHEFKSITDFVERRIRTALSSELEGYKQELNSMLINEIANLRTQLSTTISEFESRYGSKFETLMTSATSTATATDWTKLRTNLFNELWDKLGTGLNTITELVGNVERELATLQKSIEEKGGQIPSEVKSKLIAIENTTNEFRNSLTNLRAGLDSKIESIESTATELNSKVEEFNNRLNKLETEYQNLLNELKLKFAIVEEQQKHERDEEEADADKERKKLMETELELEAKIIEFRKMLLDLQRAKLASYNKSKI